MTKYLIRDTGGYYVSYLYEVEADTSEEAYDAYLDTQPPCKGHEVGDAVEFIGDGTIEVEIAGPGPRAPAPMRGASRGSEGRERREHRRRAR